MNDILIDRFIEYLQVERYYSKNTVNNYMVDILQFNEYIKKEFALVTTEDIEQYIKYLNGKYAENSIHRKYSSIKSCFKYLNGHEVINNYPFANIKLKKQSKKLPKALNQQQVLKILNSLNNNDKYSSRDQVMFELLYSTGMRISELINVKIGDVNLEERMVKVIGKGSKERYVPFGPTTAECIKIYLDTYRHTFSQRSEYLLVNKQGGQITRQGCSKIIKKYGKIIGIESLSAHMFRHSIATHLLNNGMDLKIVQEILGHSDITTTQIYTHIAKDKINQEYQKYHRLGKEKNEKI